MAATCSGSLAEHAFEITCATPSAPTAEAINTILLAEMQSWVAKSHGFGAALFDEMARAFLENFSASQFNPHHSII